MYLFHNSLSKIIKIREGRYIDAEEGQMLIDEYQKIIKETQKDIELYQKEHAKNFSALIKRVFALHALAVEEQALLRLYKKNEVNESVFKKIIERIRLQIDDLEKGQKKIQGTKYIKVKKRKIERFSSYIVTYIEKETPAIFEKYYEVRTLHVITEKALESLKILREVEFLSHYSELQEVLNDYEVFDEDAENTRRQLFKAHRDTLRKLSGELTKKSLLADEEESIEAL